MSEQRLICARDVRNALWELAEGFFAGEPDNYKFNALLETLDLQPTIEPTTPQWTSVKDGLPIVEKEELEYYATDNGKDFLVYFEGGYVEISAFWSRGNRFDDAGVTHWMPLPEPPEGGNT